MSKMFLFLFTCFILLLAVLFFLRTQPLDKNNSLMTAPSEDPTSPAQTTLHMSPKEMTITASKSASLSLTIDSQGVTPATIQFELSYNPFLLQNVTMTPGTFFTHPGVILDNVDIKTGRISYALQSIGNDKQQSGVVAIMNFNVVNTYLPLETTINFLPKSSVKDNNGQIIPIATSEATITILPLVHTFVASQSAAKQLLSH